MPVVLLLLSLAACSGDDNPDGEKSGTAMGADAFFGSFVGEVSGTEALVAVVAGPAEGEKGSGAVQIYLSDGSGLSEWFSGPISGDSFVAESDDGDAEMDGTLAADSVTGTVELPDGTTAEYRATPPSGAAGLYDLTISSAGELSGASAAGLGVTGQITLGEPGSGMLRLVDGKRLDFSVTQTPAGDLAHLRAGQVRLIVLSGGELRGMAKGQPSDAGSVDLLIQSA
ncbi:hypothetical protein [Jiangella alkaliphila]|nr:hypothetical protein [Jiangella alkaliphila]